MPKKYDIPESHTWKTKISSFDADCYRMLKPSSVLKLQQEVGDLHLTAGGLTYSALFDAGMIFVLTKARMNITRAPRYEEAVNITTWSRGTKGSQFFRCYRFTGEKGDALIDSISSFALVDTRQHRILRPAAFYEWAEGLHSADRLIGCPDPEKIIIPEGARSLPPRPVRFTDIDYNSHVNNTVYADIACDCMPRLAEGGGMKSLTLNFLSEAVLGDELTLEAAEADGMFYLKGGHARGACFTASAAFYV